MPIVNLNNIDIYYELHGQGEPMLIIAGLASDSQSWLPIIKDLSQNYQLIVFDNRGVGRTKPMNVEISISQMANDCKAIIDYLSFKKVHVLGHSMGGMIALELALRYPNTVNNLILAATSSEITSRNKLIFNDWIKYLENGMTADLWFRNMFYWIFSKEFFNDPKMVDLAVEQAVDYEFPQSPEAFQNQVEAISNFNLNESISNIKAKTLAIVGEEDIIFCIEEIYSRLIIIPGIKFSFVEGAAHSIHMEKPKEFVKIIIDFLKMT